TERVLESAELRSTHDLVQVAALEAHADLVAGLRALGAATCRLTLRGLAAADAGLGLLGTLRGTEVVSLEHLRACRLGLRLLGRSFLGGRLRSWLLLSGSLVVGLRSGSLGGRLRGSLLLSSRLVSGGLRCRSLGGGRLGSGLLLGCG